MVNYESEREHQPRVDLKSPQGEYAMKLLDLTYDLVDSFDIIIEDQWEKYNIEEVHEALLKNKKKQFESVRIGPRSARDEGRLDSGHPGIFARFRTIDGYIAEFNLYGRKDSVQTSFRLKRANASPWKQVLIDFIIGYSEIDSEFRIEKVEIGKKPFIIRKKITPENYGYQELKQRLHTLISDLSSIFPEGGAVDGI